MSEVDNDPNDAALAKAIEKEFERLISDGLSREQARERIKQAIARVYREEDDRNPAGTPGTERHMRRN